MFELVIMTKQGRRYSAEVRDWREANAELARFSKSYFKNNPRDELLNAVVLNSVGDRVSRFNGNQLEIFN